MKVVTTAEDGSNATYSITVDANGDTTVSTSDSSVVTNVDNTDGSESLTVANSTTTSELDSALTAPENGSYEIQDGNGDAVSTDDTAVTESMKVVTTAEDGSNATYSITVSSS
ncbi:hypothetical protein GLW08_10380 [Pontibacillus yanchengensis]|uniref:Uncharacterized protein n=1 Tax=Pontibacillus yanchengensis TaxID=462910 RepID=A0ACC7VG35_9BACI|nr:hypothetical protein [Pontibacillus yanchengensis]MYL53742.1 hypothetical protein [Pontibacillus yanchengensis]